MNSIKENLQSCQMNRIMVRVNNWIGDAVMNTPALGAIRATYPHAEITVVTNPLVAQLFSPHPYCDRVIKFDKKNEHKGLGGFFKFSEKLRKEKFDAAILFQKAFEAALLAFWARIPIRVGYGTDHRQLLLTHKCRFTEAVKAKHHVDHYLHLVNHFGISGGSNRQQLYCTPQELQWAKKILGNHPWIVINPGAAYGSAKRWLPERFAQVADQISTKYGVRILLSGGPGEIEIGSEIERQMSINPLNVIGKTTVREMMALLSCCRLMVTNDSGPMHVAAALQLPIVAIFGSTDHRTTSPADVAHQIVRKDFDCAPCLLRQCPTDHQCMESVTVEDVVGAVDEINQRKKIFA